MTSDRPRHGKFFPLPLSHVIVASILLAAACMAVHAGALNGQFLSWDDEAYITNNRRIQNPTWENLSWFFLNPYFNSYTPLTFVSHAVDWSLWGPDPRGHHAQSLLLHALNTVVLFWLGLFLFSERRLGAHPPSEITGRDAPAETPLLMGAATAALLFSIHPLRTETVAWISDRKDLLAGFFSLSSTLAYFRATWRRNANPSWTWIAVSVFLFALALLSKFLIVFLPLALLAAEWIFLYPDEPPARKWVRLLWKTPFLIPAICIGLLAVNSVGVDPLGLRVHDIPLMDRLALPFAIPWFYLQKIFVPANLSPVYQVTVTPATWFTAFPILAIAAIACYLLVKGRPGVLGAFVAYLVLLSPTFLFLSPLLQHTADRHSYIATMPLFLLAGGGIVLLCQRTIGQKIGGVIRMTIAALVLLISSWYGYLTIRQTRVWGDSISLWVQAITVSPDLPIGYQNLGNAVAAAGNADDAISLYRRATTIERGYGPAWTNMGVVYQLQGKTEVAEDCFRQSIAFNPDYFEAYVNLGEIEEGKNQTQEAEKLYRQAALRNPGSPKPWIHLGNLYRTKGLTDSSSACYRRAFAIDPCSVPAP